MSEFRLVTDDGVVAGRRPPSFKVGIRVAVLTAILEDQLVLDAAAKAGGITQDELTRALRHIANGGT